MDLNLHQLDVFVRVARLGGFSRAADQMGLSQAGMSILIRKLEERIGVKLFERTTRSLSLTPAGQGLLPIAERMLQDAHAILHHSRELVDRQSQRIVFALQPSLAVTMLPGALARFRQDWPQVSVVFRECVREEQVARIYSRDVDFALGFTEVDNSELESIAVGHDHLVGVHVADHPLAARKRLRWSDLPGQPIILSAPGSLARTLAESVFLSMSETLEPAYETSNHVTAVELTAAGLGIAVVSSNVRGMAERRGLVARTLHGPVIARPLRLVKRRAHTLSASARAFVDIVRAMVAEDNAPAPPPARAGRAERAA